jgi:hypothetical protein
MADARNSGVGATLVQLNVVFQISGMLIDPQKYATSVSIISFCRVLKTKGLSLPIIVADGFSKIVFLH